MASGGMADFFLLCFSYIYYFSLLISRGKRQGVLFGGTPLPAPIGYITDFFVRKMPYLVSCNIKCEEGENRTKKQKQKQKNKKQKKKTLLALAMFPSVQQN